jgi:hypothetical protein
MDKVNVDMASDILFQLNSGSSAQLLLLTNSSAHLFFCGSKANLYIYLLKDHFSLAYFSFPRMDTLFILILFLDGLAPMGCPLAGAPTCGRWEQLCS